MDGTNDYTIEVHYRTRGNHTVQRYNTTTLEDALSIAKREQRKLNCSRVRLHVHLQSWQGAWREL